MSAPYTPVQTKYILSKSMSNSVSSGSVQFHMWKIYMANIDILSSSCTTVHFEFVASVKTNEERWVVYGMVFFVHHCSILRIRCICEKNIRTKQSAEKNVYSCMVLLVQRSTYTSSHMCKIHELRTLVFFVHRSTLRCICRKYTENIDLCFVFFVHRSTLRRICEKYMKGWHVSLPCALSLD